MDFIITGIPRSGTSLVCSLLNRLPDVVALNETIDIRPILSAKGSESRISSIKSHISAARHTITTERRMPAHELSGGGDNMFRDDGNVARRSAKTGKMLSVKVERSLSSNFRIGLKNLNVFAMILPELETHFECIALVRNPLATFASWHTLDHPVRQGRVLGAKVLSKPLWNRLESIGDDRSRRVALLNWYYRRFIEVLGEDSIFRYEDIIATNGRGLESTFPSASNLPSLLDQPLRDHNWNSIYGRAFEAVADAEALLQHRDHACWRIYQPSEVSTLLRTYTSRARETVSE